MIPFSLLLAYNKTYSPLGAEATVTPIQTSQLGKIFSSFVENCSLDTVLQHSP